MSDGVATLLADYARAWSRIAAEHILPFWDADAFRFYKAEEVDRPFTRWPDAVVYWEGNARLHRAVKLAFADPQAVPLAADWRTVVTRMRWDIRFADAAPAAVAGKAMGGENHVVMLLHGDRLAAWGEMPDAPVSYIRGMHMALARDV